MKRRPESRFPRRLRWATAIGLALGVVSARVPAAELNEAALAAAKASVTDEELRTHVGTLAADALEGREAGTRGGLAAARYLEARMVGAGLRPAGDDHGFAQRFNGRMQNLLGIRPGADPQVAGEVILIGAHYDHVGYGAATNSNGPVGYIHNGADDNASGVSAILEIADALAAIDYQPRRTILFALWDGEEKNLLGSRHWARNSTLPIEQVKLSINIDMVGRLRNGVLTIGGTRTAYDSRQLMASDRLPAGMKLDFSWEFKENSDHWPLFAAGVPALVVNTGLHDDYHRPSDDVEKVNVGGMRDVTQYLVEALLRIDAADELPRYRSRGATETPALAAVREAPLPQLAPRSPLEFAAPADGDQGGVTIVAVRNNAGASNLGIRPRDRVVACNGVAVERAADLELMLLAANSPVELSVIAVDGATARTVQVPLAGKPIEFGASWRGDEAEPHSVFVTRVTPSSLAARAGLAPGDRIYAVDGRPVAGDQDLLVQLREALAGPVRDFTLLVETAGRLRTVVINRTAFPTPASDATL